MFSDSFNWFCTFVQIIDSNIMKNFATLLKIIALSVLIIFVACVPQPDNQQKSQLEIQSEEELKKQSDDFIKSMDNIDEAMDMASQLNQRIQLVEKRFKDEEITREKADELIQAINRRYGQRMSEASGDATRLHVFPSWLQNIGIVEPQGLRFDVDNSFQTKENNVQEGYNSVLYVYHGNYKKAMKEAERIANAAGIPMSENYRKAKELSKKLGKEIEGLKGVTYMNFEFGEKEFSKPYKISISVLENGKFTLNVADVKTKSEREKIGSTPIKY